MVTVLGSRNGKHGFWNLIVASCVILGKPDFPHLVLGGNYVPTAEAGCEDYMMCVEHNARFMKRAQ